MLALLLEPRTTGDSSPILSDATAGANRESPLRYVSELAGFCAVTAASRVGLIIPEVINDASIVEDVN